MQGTHTSSKLKYTTFMYQRFIYNAYVVCNLDAFFQLSRRNSEKPERSELEVDPMTLDY